MNKLMAIFFVMIFSNLALSQQPRYRMILPPAPPQPPALNNTVQPQIANQNINFNTGSNISGFGGGFGVNSGGFNVNSGGIQGTIQYTQNNTPGMQISLLYQLPMATQFQYNFNQGGFNQGGFNQGGNMNGQPIGVNNPFYQMAMQGITAGVSGSAFQSGSMNMGGQYMRFGQFGGNQFGNNQFGFGNQFGNNQFGFNNQFNNNQFGFGGGFNNGGNGL